VESLLFVLDTLIVLLLVFWTVRNDRRPPGTPSRGLFRYRPGAEAPLWSPRRR
jgi:hypothetical protein